MEENIREGEIRMMMKDLVGCFQVSKLSSKLWFIMVSICLTTEVEINHFATYLKLLFFAIVEFFARTEYFHSTKVGGALSILGCNKYQAKWHHVALCWQKNGDRGSPIQTVAANYWFHNLRQEEPSVPIFGTIWISRGFIMVNMLNFVFWNLSRDII